MDGNGFDPRLVEEVAKIVYDNCGIVFKESNLSVLVSRLSSKTKQKNLNLEQYLSQLRTDQQELVSFIDFVTTNFTSFFRNTSHFSILESLVLPDVLARNSVNREIRIWSAGSSTGEEAYTIAIVISEYFQKHKLDINQWNIRIVGSDISLESLFIAKEGRYPARSVKKIDAGLVEKYFIEEPGQEYYTLKEPIRKMVKFDFHNLIYDANLDQLDITFCRNVLIYFDTDIQVKVVDKIHQAMKPDAYLFIGHSESLTGLYDGFQIKSLPEGIVYVRK